MTNEKWERIIFTRRPNIDDETQTYIDHRHTHSLTHSDPKNLKQFAPIKCSTVQLHSIDCWTEWCVEHDVYMNKSWWWWCLDGDYGREELFKFHKQKIKKNKK